MQDTEVWPAGVVLGLTMLGATDEAFDYFDRHFEEIGGNDLFTLWRLEAAPLRPDPRFVGLLRRLGLVEYWQASGWPDLCTPEGDGLLCR